MDADSAADVYVGHLGLGPDPRLAQRVRDADVLLVIGDRLSEIHLGVHAPRCPEPGAGTRSRHR